MSNTLSIGYSPCPNDCFIFGAIALKKIDTKGIDFNIHLEDVEALNQNAVKQTYDITKLSFHAFAHLTKNYILLNSGSALGFGVGPLLISKNTIDPKDTATINQLKIAIPGRLTTANFLLSIAYPDAKNKTEILFSAIESKVLSGEYDAGLIIHENRFTYESKGLKKIIDCGEFWESLIHAPIPLGGIVMKRQLDITLIKTVDQIILNSLNYAYENTAEIMPYVRAHAQEMEEAVMQKHIHLYVNAYSKDLGQKGIEAINLLFKKAIDTNIIDTIHQPIIIDK
jgi:1,4-dihydroxy-6-naphthoate synthase